MLSIVIAASLLHFHGCPLGYHWHDPKQGYPAMSLHNDGWIWSDGYDLKGDGKCHWNGDGQHEWWDQLYPYIPEHGR